MKKLTEFLQSDSANYNFTALDAPILEYLYTEVTSANTSAFYSFIEDKSNIQYSIWEYSNNLFYIFKSVSGQDNVELFKLSVSSDNKARQWQASQINTNPVNVSYRQNEIRFIGQYFNVKHEFFVATPFFDPYRLKYYLLDAFFGFGQGWLDFEYDKNIFHFTPTSTGHYGIHSIHTIDSGSDTAINRLQTYFNGETILNLLGEGNPIRILSREVNKLLNPTWLLTFPPEGIAQVSGFKNKKAFVINRMEKISSVVIQNDQQTAIPHIRGSPIALFRIIGNPIPVISPKTDTSAQLIAITDENKALISIADFSDYLSIVKVILVDYSHDFKPDDFVIRPFILDIIQ